MAEKIIQKGNYWLRILLGVVWCYWSPLHNYARYLLEMKSHYVCRYYKCQRANRFVRLIFTLKKFTAELHPIPVWDKVWHTIGVDLVGPLPKTSGGSKYILTVSDFFPSGQRPLLYLTRMQLL